VTHELGLRGPFQTLLDKTAKKRGWTLVPELSTYSGGKRVVHPNREDDPAYIVHLVGQVVRVSFATVQIVKSLPNYRWRTKLL
jgi:O-acetyl-ADP-ribose deacetylase (regulator of RNase III)